MDKPLHVRVAEALGWTEVHFDDDATRKAEMSEAPATNAWQGMPPGSDYFVRIPDFSTDWKATGPLIERFGIRLFVLAGTQGWATGYAINRDGSLSLPGEYAFDVMHPEMVPGATPLLAVCNLILALAEAGKLPK